MSITPDGFQLDPDQIARLSSLAAEMGKPLPVVVNDALAAYHPEQGEQAAKSDETFFDLASRLGLVGCIQGTPSDLSTNPKHMEGFGQGDS
jgi:hypothetical protein